MINQQFINARQIELSWEDKHADVTTKASFKGSTTTVINDSKQSFGQQNLFFSKQALDIYTVQNIHLV